MEKKGRSAEPMGDGGRTRNSRYKKGRYFVAPIYQCTKQTYRSDYKGGPDWTPAEIRKQVDRFYEKKSSGEEMRLVNNHFNHSQYGTGEEVGTVREMWVDNKDRLMIMGYINPLRQISQKWIRDLESGTGFVGVSHETPATLTHRDDGTYLYEKHDIRGVAMTDEPDLGTFVENFDTDRHKALLSIIPKTLEEHQSSSGKSDSPTYAEPHMADHLIQEFKDKVKVPDDQSKDTEPKADAAEEDRRVLQGNESSGAKDQTTDPARPSSAKPTISELDTEASVSSTQRANGSPEKTHGFSLAPPPPLHLSNHRHGLESPATTMSSKQHNDDSQKSPQSSGGGPESSGSGAHGGEGQQRPQQHPQPNTHSQHHETDENDAMKVDGGSSRDSGGGNQQKQQLQLQEHAPHQTSQSSSGNPQSQQHPQPQQHQGNPMMYGGMPPMMNGWGYPPSQYYPNTYYPMPPHPSWGQSPPQQPPQHNQAPPGGGYQGPPPTQQGNGADYQGPSPGNPQFQQPQKQAGAPSHYQGPSSGNPQSQHPQQQAGAPSYYQGPQAPSGAPESNKAGLGDLYQALQGMKKDADTSRQLSTEEGRQEYGRKLNSDLRDNILEEFKGIQDTLYEALVSDGYSHDDAVASVNNLRQESPETQKNIISVARANMPSSHRFQNSRMQNNGDSRVGQKRPNPYGANPMPESYQGKRTRHDASAHNQWNQRVDSGHLGFAPNHMGGRQGADAAQPQQPTQSDFFKIYQGKNRQAIDDPALINFIGHDRMLMAKNSGHTSERLLSPQEKRFLEQSRQDPYVNDILSFFESSKSARGIPTQWSDTGTVVDNSVTHRNVGF